VIKVQLCFIIDQFIIEQFIIEQFIIINIQFFCSIHFLMNALNQAIIETIVYNLKRCSYITYKLLMYIFFIILLHPIVISYLKHKKKVLVINFSLFPICNKILNLFIENLLLHIFTIDNLPSLNNSPIIILISLLMNYMMRRIVRTYSIYQSLIHLYHPEDEHIYWLGSYYISCLYNFVEIAIKLFIITTVIDKNYWNSLIYLSIHNLIEMCVYYSKTNDSSNELFHITSNYLFKKLNE